MEPLSQLISKTKSTFWRQGRLGTYEYWPFQSSDNMCNPERMASAGFYCVGSKEEPDLVECFICHKQLDGWDPDDDPWKEHEKHQPSCYFVRLNKQDELSLTTEDVYYLLLESSKKQLMDKLDHSIGKIKESIKNGANQIPGIYQAVRRSRKNL